MILNGLWPVDLRKAISNSLLQSKEKEATILYKEQHEAKKLIRSRVQNIETRT